MENLKLKAWNRIVKRFSAERTIEEIYNTKDVQFQNLIFLLFSGFKDINNIEIYQGDICELGTGDIILIKFINGCFVIETKDKIWDIYLHLLFEKKVSIKIIGNIYKNPELFK